MRPCVFLMNTKTNTMKYTWILALAVASFTVGCRGSEQKPAPGTIGAAKEEKQEKVEREVSTEPKQEVAIELGSNDQMQYDKKELKVPANSMVTLTLKHNGTMPKEAMGHNFVLLKAGTDIAAFGMKAIEAGIAKEHIPDSEAVIAHTGLIGGGEQTTITFDAPAPGTYDYICSFPGHYAMMQGKLIVE
jgi:azurin